MPMKHLPVPLGVPGRSGIIRRFKSDKEHASSDSAPRIFESQGWRRVQSDGGDTTVDGFENVAAGIVETRSWRIQDITSMSKRHELASTNYAYQYA
ncbi:hypothetical protein Dda_5627 [Drechslerella dactyloides]|uniref:Uncharacterized protein n=1 Tax=Drechslerella dactyloides TaxID=74499 RepID=A0AAD6IWF7_DREDA|nr:hypothetical protein Dda_5627 [Drechslerella dactyloides]